MTKNNLYHAAKAAMAIRKPHPVKDRHHPAKMALCTWSYYQKKSDSTYWAILVHLGEPVKAFGPITDVNLSTPTPSYAKGAVDASALNLDDFAPVGGCWAANHPGAAFRRLY